MRFALLALALVLSLSCASTPKKKAKRPKAPETPESVTPSTSDLEQQILAQTKETASKELDCPVEQLLARCTHHDAQGGCTAIHVTGCEKTMDYQFGEE